MAFDMTRVHGNIACQFQASRGRIVLPEMYSSDSGNSSVSSEDQFPSPRSWFAARRSGSPDHSPSPPDTLSEADWDGSSDACAEIAEQMAYSCMDDDETSSRQKFHQEYIQYAKPHVSTPPPRPIQNPNFIHDIHTGARRPGVHQTAPTCGRTMPANLPGSVAWSAACSSESSQTGSPTSVLGEAGSAAWDLLFAAAGEVQKLAREQDALAGNRYANSPRSMHHLLLNRGHTHAHAGPVSKLSKSPLASTVYAESPVSEYVDPNTPDFTNSQLYRSASPVRRGGKKCGGNGARGQAHLARSAGAMSPQKTRLARPGTATPPEDLSCSKKSLYNDFNSAGSPLSSSPVCSPRPLDPVKDAKVGTGVFLPRSAVPPPVETRTPVKKVNKPATVILPARLVHALGLNVDPESNVVIGKPLQPSRRPSGNKSQQVHLPPVMRVAPDDDVLTMTKSSRHANCRQPYSSKARSQA
eukprot:TRINITY_DN32926_c0_g1_i1.p1 TRINITY_DN32926_c0_g1~~TRINITY_DN32926_c0_g1_i1.p1  ORF type:complete len:469 (+),score=43.74 TRINITY_DN32926_c0_g1_i1:239-1645(+)